MPELCFALSGYLQECPLTACVNKEQSNECFPSNEKLTGYK